MTPEERFQLTRCQIGSVRILKLNWLKTQRELAILGYADYPLRIFIQKIIDSLCPFLIHQQNNWEVVDKEGKAIIQLWERNLRIRFQFKRLLNAWLIRKATAKIILIPHFVTLENPRDEDCVKWIDLKNRCTYVLDGGCLLKSAKMNLLTQSFSIPEPVYPRNPLTNESLHIGQLMEIFPQLNLCCARGRIAFPAIISTFQENQFNLELFATTYLTELSYQACVDYFRNFTSNDVLKVWIEIVSEYNSRVNTISARFRAQSWALETRNEDDKKLLKEWSILCPYVVHYHRFQHLRKKEWFSEDDIEKDIIQLWKETLPRIRKFHNLEHS